MEENKKSQGIKLLSFKHAPRTIFTRRRALISAANLGNACWFLSSRDWESRCHISMQWTEIAQTKRSFSSHQTANSHGWPKAAVFWPRRSRQPPHTYDREFEIDRRHWTLRHATGRLVRRSRRPVAVVSQPQGDPSSCA